jgi:peptidoglycan/LPS O-acetylase OafA/YrhL
MCYTIYLYHFFVLSALTRVLPDMPADALAGSYFPLRTVLLVLGGIVFCIPAYLLVERPFQLWRPGRNRLKDCFLWPK